MKIEGDYLIVEIDDDSSVLGVVQRGDALGSDGDWHVYTYGWGARFHGKARWNYRRPINQCSPQLLAMVQPEQAEAQHFI